jgi:enoyl-CoA hydratase
MQMLMTGDPISAQEAYRLGMVNELYAQDELLDAAYRIAGKIAGPPSPIPTTDARAAARIDHTRKAE